MIIILDSKEEVEIIFQLVIEEQTPQAPESGYVEERSWGLDMLECPIFCLVLGIFLYSKIPFED